LKRFGTLLASGGTKRMQVTKQCREMRGSAKKKKKKLKKKKKSGVISGRPHPAGSTEVKLTTGIRSRITCQLRGRYLPHLRTGEELP